MGGFFLKTKPGPDPEISRREGGELIWLVMVYFMIMPAKEEYRKQSFIFNFQVKMPSKFKTNNLSNGNER